MYTHSLSFCSRANIPKSLPSTAFNLQKPRHQILLLNLRRRRRRRREESESERNGINNKQSTALYNIPWNPNPPQKKPICSPSFLSHPKKIQHQTNPISSPPIPKQKTQFRKPPKLSISSHLGHLPLHSPLPNHPSSPCLGQSHHPTFLLPSHASRSHNTQFIFLPLFPISPPHSPKDPNPSIF